MSQAVSIISIYGRSFRLAGRLLPGATFRDAAELYAFCRAVDDIADGGGDATDAHHSLAAVRLAILQGDQNHPVAARYIVLARRKNMDVQAAVALIDMLLQDAGPVRLADEASLLRYAYGVAGTVGLMMCGVLGARDPRATPHAIDLGMAMQLTNIARDVVEDAAHGRLYLPATWLPARLAPDNIAAAPEAVFAAVRLVLQRASQRYRSAAGGIRYLPASMRPAIRAASALYEEIGVRILRRGPDYLQEGRVVVPGPRRLWLLTASVWADIPRAPHDRSLHAALRGAPGAHA
jgi:phytoene synthase